MSMLNNINYIITEARSHSDVNKKLTLFEHCFTPIEIVIVTLRLILLIK